MHSTYVTGGRIQIQGTESLKIKFIKHGGTHYGSTTHLSAMNANRMLNVTTSAQSKSTEKLSSGYKINRAADDAAGLLFQKR